MKRATLCPYWNSSLLWLQIYAWADPVVLKVLVNIGMFFGAFGSSL